MNIVISGASKGIGYEIAVKYAQLGHRVLAISRDLSRLHDLKGRYENIQIISTDLSVDDNNEDLKQRISDFGKLNIIINNAGQLINKEFLATPLKDFQSQFQANVLSAVNLSQVCSAFMESESHIVNISSMGGFQGSIKFPGLSAYSASKGALSVLTECMAEEFKHLGISVNALALGAVQTEMLHKAFPNYTAPISGSKMAEFIVDFGLNGHKFFNGKILPVALSNP